MAEDLQTHLDKYLPQLLRSHRLLPPQGESLSQVQLLTVQQATSGDQSSHGMHGDQGSVGVQAPAPGVEAVVRELSPGHQAAAMVVGLLKTNNCGELTLEDNTGKANCEVSVKCADRVLTLQLSHGPSEMIALLTKWQYVASLNRRRCDGYFEVSEMEVLSNNSTKKTLPSLDEVFTVADSLRHRTRNIPSRTNTDIVAMVTAVGEVLRDIPGGGKCLFTVELRDDKNTQQYRCLIVQTPSLLYMSKMMVLHETYLFTRVRDMVMNKGVETERRVLVTTAESLIQPYQCVREVQPPDRKKMREEEPGSHDHNMTLPRAHFISYQGVLTECLSPEAGLYRLDSGVLLYMTHRHCINGGRGLRSGALLELHNVHAMKLSSPLQRASGFYCCAKSSVNISQFSHNYLAFKPFTSQNKLCRFLKRYSSTDAAYLIHTYLSLRKRYNVETSFSIVKELAKIAGLSPFKRDDMSEFFSSPHCCPFTRVQGHHGDQPVVAGSLCDFHRSLRERAMMSGVKWGSSEKQLAGTESSNASLVGHTEQGQWSYVVLSSSDLPAQVLVGCLEGCVKTGHVTITDGSGALPVVCLLTQHGDSSQENILEALGSTVLLSGLTVCVERKTTAQQPGITSSTLSIYIHPQLCSVITESPRSELSNVLYFRVVNKNCVVVTALSGMRFSAQVQMGESPCSLREEDKCGSSCKIVDIALCFSEENFRWYSYVINGGVYSLSSPKKLPSLTELSQSNFLQVMSDMQLKFIDHSPLQQRVYDVTSLIDRVTLPGFLKESTTSADKSMWMEIFSLKVVIVSHEYRVHHSSLLATPITTTPPSSTAKPLQQSSIGETILALRVQSLTHPDTIMLYYSLKAGQPHPLGLLPGTVATFHSLFLRTSRSGNVYCESTASSSITLHSLSGVSSCACQQPSSSSGTELTPQLLSLPSVHLSDLMRSLLSGSLTQRIVCVQCRLSSVQRVSLSYKCLGCDCTVVDGVCMAVCPQSRPTFKAEARFILDDGSGEGQLYATNDMVRQTMGLSQREWAELNEILLKIGHLVYAKGHQEQAQGESGRLLTTESRGKARLLEFATRASIHRALKLYCQPFVSNAEIQECVLGQKQQIRRGYSTLSLPRLQLRGVAVLELTGCNTGVCTELTRQLLTKLKQLE